MENSYIESIIVYLSPSIYIDLYRSVSRFSFIQTSEDMLQFISNPKTLGLNSKSYIEKSD